MSTLAESPFLTRIAEHLGECGLLLETADVCGYEEGWRYGKGRALAVARPRTAEQVAWLLALAAEHEVRVQPIGANTGLVGASNPDATGEQLVISLERLRGEIVLDARARTVVVGAGMTLAQLNAELEPHGLVLPIDLGADPQIGGMIATNTGGTRLVRYGPMRRYVLGLEVALADGTIHRQLSALWKDNRGLSVNELFVGTTGAFGIITRATLSLEPLPKQRAAAWLALNNADAALDLLSHLEHEAGEFLSAFEVLSQTALKATLQHGANLDAPFEGPLPERAVLIELSTTLSIERLDLDALLLEVLESFLEQAEDSVLDVYPQKPHVAWELRHQVSESLRHEGRVLALDVSVPRGSIARFTEDVTRLITDAHPDVRVADFGHWGDGGTHLNLILDPELHDAEFASELQNKVYAQVRAFEGSFSAEHGIGPHNHKNYVEQASPIELAVCRVLADHFDPARRLGNVRLEG